MAIVLISRRRRRTRARTWAGYRQAHFARSTGTMVVVLNGAEADLDTGDGTMPWSTLCDDHSEVVCHPTLQLARWHASFPESWCHGCREGV